MQATLRLMSGINIHYLKSLLLSTVISSGAICRSSYPVVQVIINRFDLRKRPFVDLKAKLCKMRQFTEMYARKLVTLVSIICHIVPRADLVHRS